MSIPCRSPCHLVYGLEDQAPLLQHINSKVNQMTINYLVDAISETVDVGLGHRPSNSPRGSKKLRTQSVLNFVAVIIERAGITMSVILTCLVYLERSKAFLCIGVDEWAHERVFLGALILASKYVNDSSLKNSDWARCTELFSKNDIGRIEREFLDVLDFDLHIKTSDFSSHLAVLVSHQHQCSRCMPALSTQSTPEEVSSKAEQHISASLQKSCRNLQDEACMVWPENANQAGGLIQGWLRGVSTFVSRCPSFQCGCQFKFEPYL